MNARPVFPLANEVRRLSSAWIKHAFIRSPLRIINSSVRDSGLSPTFDEASLIDLFADELMGFMQDAGPVYGKLGQFLLSRLPDRMQLLAAHLQLTRLYSDWPVMDPDEVKTLLDSEIPHWRKELKVDLRPIGSASMAQVHKATDLEGRVWALKLIKPKARARLLESLAVLKRLQDMLSPLVVSRNGKRLVSELESLRLGFQKELNLAEEAATIDRIRERLSPSKSKVLRIPEVNDPLSSEQVLCLEYYRGVSLSDVVTGKAELSSSMRRKLARRVLHELLVQVFEWGLFHADPHAGNLILLDDGSVGLFDWGLAGELKESDRKHIAGMLRAVITMDLDRLAAVLLEMAEESGNTKITTVKIKKELKKISAKIKRGEEDSSRKPSLRELIELCLGAAAKLKIELPTGLFLMAKSLMTIDGLARGLDPDVSMGRVATPVLLRAAKPSVSDLWQLTKKLPQVTKKFFG